MREIPRGSSVTWNGSRYQIDSEGVATLCANGTSDGDPGQLAVCPSPHICERSSHSHQDATTGDPFSPGAVAELPNGFRYIKTGDIWLLAPIPTPVPVVLTSRVPGFEEYWVSCPRRRDTPGAT